jgi:hypothetical protein
VWIGYVERTSLLYNASRSRSLDKDIENRDLDLLNGQIIIKRDSC